MAERFRYTEEQWAAIARELPGGGAGVPGVRIYMEVQVDSHKLAASTPRLRREIIRNCNIASAAALKLGQALHALDHLTVADDDQIVYPIELDTDDFSDQHFMIYLQFIMLKADRLSAYLGGLRGRARHDGRDELVKQLLMAWLATGGALKASSAGSRANGGGPLVRFLIAATKPANVCPALTIDSARELVRAYKPVLRESCASYAKHVNWYIILERAPPDQPERSKWVLEQLT